MENTTNRCKGCGEETELFNAGYCDPCHNVKVHAGYTRRELKEAFELVQDTQNWKNPINRMVPTCSGADLNLITSAVVFFAGCVPTFRVDRKTGCTIVKAAGYYAAVGA
jgi:hypothetical protein